MLLSDTHVKAVVFPMCGAINSSVFGYVISSCSVSGVVTDTTDSRVYHIWCRVGTQTCV